MKTFILLTFLALVACSYAAPTSDLAAVEALLNNLKDAQLESLLNVQAQDDNDDGDGIAALMAMMQDDDGDGLAEIEAMLQDARFQSWFKKAFNKVKKFGKKAYSGIKKVAENPIVGALGKQLLSKYVPIPVDAQDDNDDGDGIAALMAMMQDDNDDDGLAEIEAMLQDARFQSWFKKAFNKVKKFGKKAYSGIKKVAENPIVGALGKQLLSKYVPISVDAQDDNDDGDGIAALMAMMQDDNDMLQDARFQSFWSSLKKYGKKALDTAKKVASNPLVGEVGQHLLSKYLPVDAQDDNDDGDGIAALMAMMQDDNDDDGIEAMLQDVQFQSFWSILKKYGKNALDTAKKVASNPLVGEVGQHLLSKYLPVDAQDDDTEIAALVNALLLDA